MTINQALTEEGLDQILRRVNTLRHTPRLDPWSSCHAIVEEVIDTIFNASNHLAVYGTLAPGKPNHGVIADVPGRWLEGYVCGQLYEEGWGSSIGFPGMTWNPDGPKEDVWLFVSEQLPQHWERLDDFEGKEYRRSLVPVYQRNWVIAVANIYEICR